MWQFVSGAAPASFGTTGVFIAAAVVFFAYSGFEAVANLGEETNDPAKDMPRGLLGTLAICTLRYIGVCFVLTGMVKYSNLSEGAPISDAFKQVGLGWAGVLIAIAAVAGLSSVILVDIVAMGRSVHVVPRWSAPRVDREDPRELGNTRSGDGGDYCGGRRPGCFRSAGHALSAVPRYRSCRSCPRSCASA